MRLCETTPCVLAPPRGPPCDTPKMARGQIRRIPEVHPSGSGKSRIGKNRKGSRGQPRNVPTAFGGARGRPEDALGINPNLGKIPAPRSPPALSVQLKEKRDAAILELHKEGMSNRAIAKLFKMSPNNGHNVVKEVIENALVENPDSGKSTTPEVSTSVVPRMTLRPLTENRESRKSVTPLSPCVCLRKNASVTNFLTPASACGELRIPQNSAPPLSPCP